MAKKETKAKAPKKATAKQSATKAPAKKTKKAEPKVVKAPEKNPVSKKARKPRGIPPCPKPNETDGDKTPEIVAWYKKYEPEVYKEKYHAFEQAKVQGRGKLNK